MKLYDLSVFSKKELCSIYYSLLNRDWDKRLGIKPYGFDEFSEVEKRSFLQPFVTKIETLTSAYDRKKYERVRLRKIQSEEEFNKWWSELENK